MKKAVKRNAAFIIAIIMAILCAGCGNNNAGTTSGVTGSVTDKNETNPSENGNTESNSSDSKVLIAYFSWSGNTEALTEMLEKETGADVFRIVPETSYGEDFDQCAQRAQNELNEGIRPELSSHMDKETMAEYDVILLGFPIWWYDLPMPVWTFLEEYDFSGKTIIPYFTHNGSSGGAGSLETIEKLCPDSTVMTDNALSVAGNDVDNAEEQAKEWISQLGFAE